MLLDDLQDVISTGGMGTAYKDYMPPTPDSVVSIYGAGGQGPTHTMKAPHVLEEPRVQVICRAESLQSAHQTARGVYGLLNGVRNRDVNGVRSHWITAEQEPFLLGRDQNARFTVACNYAVKKDRST